MQPCPTVAEVGEVAERLRGYAALFRDVFMYHTAGEYPTLTTYATIHSVIWPLKLSGHPLLYRRWQASACLKTTGIPTLGPQLSFLHHVSPLPRLGTWHSLDVSEAAGAGETLPAEIEDEGFVLEDPNRFQWVTTMLSDPDRVADYISKNCVSEVITQPRSWEYTIFLLPAEENKALEDPEATMMQCVDNFGAWDSFQRYSRPNGIFGAHKLQFSATMPFCCLEIKSTSSIP